MMKLAIIETLKNAETKKTSFHSAKGTQVTQNQDPKKISFEKRNFGKNYKK